MVAACTESAFLPLCFSGVVRLARILCRVMARYPDLDGSCGFQGAGYQELQAGHPAANSLGKIKKAAPQGTKRFCRGQAAAKWFGMVAERLFSILKWLVCVRGYHGRGKVSMAYCGFWTISRTYHSQFVKLHKSKTSPDKPSGLCYTISVTQT